jgi:hypothetical protein
MNRIITTLVVVTVFEFAFGVASFAKANNTAGTTINPILGDCSFIERFGYAPTQHTSESVRIRTHLAYVERVLRRKDVSHLPHELQAQRTMLLDKLNEYWRTGRFPKNYSGVNGRKPCFIDKDGTICAVGYLVEQSAGRSLAESINARHQYNTIKTMKMRELLAWVKKSGLTLEECAMIQPQYSSITPIPTSYAVASGTLSGFNIALATINIEQITNGSNAKVAPFLGLANGSASIIIGSLNLFQEVKYWGPWFGKPDDTMVLNPLSVVNIGMGAASIFLSTWNLLSDSPQSQTTSLNVYSLPLPQHQVSLGLQFTHKF